MNKFTLKSVLLLFALMLFVHSGCKAAPNIQDEEIDVAKIIKKIQKGENIYLKNKTITGNLDFTILDDMIPESNGLFRTHVKSSLTFLDCTFKGKVIAYKKDDNRNQFCFDFLYNVSFISCQMEDEVNFRDAIIRGQANFVKTVFHKPAIFEGVSFRFKDNYFSEAIFKEKTKFQRTIFYGNVHFLRTDFNQPISFQNTIIQGVAQFGNAQFDAYADFSKMDARAGIIFNYAKFGGKAIFDHSQVSTRADYNDCRFAEKVGFINVVFIAPANFDRAVFSKEIDFSGSVFFNGKPDLADAQYEEEMVYMENTKIIQSNNLKIQ